jgi:hypothetical protein
VSPGDAIVWSGPVRADLAGVQPMYYPVIEHSRHRDWPSLCAAFGVRLADVQPYIDRARVERSEQVVIDALRFGDPNDKQCAVIVRKPGGRLLLCVGDFGVASTDQAAILALVDELRELPVLAGRRVWLGEFRPNVRGPAQ